MPAQVSGNGGSSLSVCSTEGAAFWAAARSARAVLSVLWVESRTLGHVGPWAGGTAFASTFGTIVPTVDVQPVDWSSCSVGVVEAFWAVEAFGVVEAMEVGIEAVVVFAAVTAFVVGVALVVGAVEVLLPY